MTRRGTDSDLGALWPLQELSEENDSVEESCTEVQKESTRWGIEAIAELRRVRLVFGLPGRSSSQPLLHAAGAMRLWERNSVPRAAFPSELLAACWLRVAS